MAIRTPRFLLAALLTLAPGLLGCDGALAVMAGEPMDGQPLPVSDWSGSSAKVTVTTFVTARTPDEWTALWAQAGGIPPGPLPDGKMAVAVFLGQRFTSGFKVEIEEAEVHQRSGSPEEPVVRWRELAPLTGHDVSKKISSPWAIRLMQYAVLPPDFHKLS